MPKGQYNNKSLNEMFEIYQKKYQSYKHVTFQQSNLDDQTDINITLVLEKMKSEKELEEMIDYCDAALEMLANQNKLSEIIKKGYSIKGNLVTWNHDFMNAVAFAIAVKNAQRHMTVTSGTNLESISAISKEWNGLYRHQLPTDISKDCAFRDISLMNATDTQYNKRMDDFFSDVKNKKGGLCQVFNGTHTEAYLIQIDEKNKQVNVICSSNGYEHHNFFARLNLQFLGYKINKTHLQGMKIEHTGNCTLDSDMNIDILS